jgi:hypothetical protein
MLITDARTAYQIGSPLGSLVSKGLLLGPQERLDKFAGSGESNDAGHYDA